MNVESFSVSPPHTSSRLRSGGRWLLLLLILFTFARLTWQLEAKHLWWDESLSLQRAEGDWVSLLAGRIVISDGVIDRVTVDQHPFGYFVLLGLAVRMAGESEFVLRFVSVMAATLILPGVWVLGRALVRLQVLVPPAAPIAFFLAAGSPFFLWYGQEARMYTLVALLAVLSSYTLIGWANEKDSFMRRWRLFAYVGVTAAFLSSHYFAVLLLPVHALVLMGAVRHRRKLALFLVGTGLVVVASFVGTAAWFILRQPHSGSNFVSLPLSILVPDLLNAYSLGLSVNIDQVWWLDLCFGLLALLGALWAVRRAGWQQGGWVLPALLIVPVGLLVMASQIQPAYMNARHLGLISGFFLLLVAGGVGFVWQRYWIAGVLICGLLAGGMAYSTINYFTLPEYNKDNFAGLDQMLRREMMPGDVLLLLPPHLQRLYRYYLPVDALTAAQAAGGTVAWRGVPIFQGWDDNEALLAGLAGNYRRAWLITSLMYPFADPEERVETWLTDHALRIREGGFYSANSVLEWDLFLLNEPVAAEIPNDISTVQADFGSAIRLEGYQVGQPLWPGGMIPVTYYWRGLRPLDKRYKYIAELESDIDGQAIVSRPTEREFYDGFLPSIWWTPGTLIREESGIQDVPLEKVGNTTFSLQLYALDTLEKLPVVNTVEGTIGDDGVSLNLPFPLFLPQFGQRPEN